MINNDGKRNECPELYTRKETTKEIVCSFTKLIDAERRCKRNVGYKNSVSRFDLNLLTKIYELKKELISESYRPKKGDVFEIYEPKHRIITTTKFRDRIPQASFVINYMYPVIIKEHTRNNCACVKNKGVQYARDLFKYFLRNSNIDSYCVVSDFKNYFGSIEHKKMFDELNPFLKERWVNMYFKMIISSNEKEIGIDLGNEVNQLASSSYFCNLDNILSDRRYIRYMDDIRFIGSKQECINALNIIKSEADRLGITLSKSKTYIQKISRPIKFLGFTFLLHPSHKITMKRIKSKLTREKRKLRKMKANNIPFERVQVHYQSVRSVMKKGNRSGVVKLDKYFNNIFKEEILNANCN